VRSCECADSADRLSRAGRDIWKSSRLQLLQLARVPAVRARDRLGDHPVDCAPPMEGDVTATTQ
jgi:hypothetical protein